MHLLIDGDALPNLLKPILCKQIARLQIPTTVIADKRIRLGENAAVGYEIVEAGADAADHRIVEMVEEGDWQPVQAFADQRSTFLNRLKR